MDPQQLFDELVLVALRLGVEVRVQPFETPATMGGGLCVVRGEKLVLIDRKPPLRGPPRRRGPRGARAPEGRGLQGAGSWGAHRASPRVIGVPPQRPPMGAVRARLSSSALRERRNT